MDRAYYQIIRETHDISILATAIVENADYKKAIKDATDPLVLEIITRLQHVNLMLQKVRDKQEWAYTQSKKG